MLSKTSHVLNHVNSIFGLSPHFPLSVCIIFRASVILTKEDKWKNINGRLLFQTQPLFPSSNSHLSLSEQKKKKTFITTYPPLYATFRCGSVNVKSMSLCVLGPGAGSGWVVEKAGRVGEESGRAWSSGERAAVPRSRRRSVGSCLTLFSRLPLKPQSEWSDPGQS